MLPQYPTVSATVQQREVIAHGALVLLRTDKEAAIRVDDLTFFVAFIEDAGEVAVDVQVIDNTTIRIRFTGTIGPLGVGYDLPYVGTWNGFIMSLAFMVHEIGDDAFIRQVAYTLTGKAMSLSGEIPDGE